MSKNKRFCIKDKGDIMRKETSIKNGIVSIIATITTILATFVTQRILVQYLGIEYQGLNGLFTNIISMLSIVELGIGPAIVYNLYKPVAEKDVEKIKSLMKLYKTSYNIIAIIIFIIGMLLLPFMDIIVGDTTIPRIELLYILVLIDTIVSYLLTYKRSILFANQKNYIVNIIHTIYTVVLNIAQILILIFTRNFILFLGIRIVCRIIENIVTSIVASKLYSYINDKNVQQLDGETKKDIFTKVKGLLFHKISGFIVLGTDNLLMSTFFGLTTVGIYTNYTTVITAVTTLVGQVFNSILGTIGNVLVTETTERKHRIYLNLELLNFWIYSLVSVGFYCCIQPFINVWIGEGYLFGRAMLFAIAFNLFMTGMRTNVNTFKSAAGIYHEDRFVPVAESIINIVASLILLKVFGVIGIVLGTIISSCVLFLYSYPKYVYSNLFNRPKREYLLLITKYFVLHIVVLLVTSFVTQITSISNNYLEILKNVVIVLLMVNVTYICLFRKTEEYKYFKDIILSKLKRSKKV